MKFFPSEKQVLTDAVTGMTVWRMTSGTPKSVSCYQTVEAFSGDDRYVIFSSDRTGFFQLYRVELESGEIAQLSDATDFKKVSFGIARNGHEAVYTAGWRVFAVDVYTGKMRVLIDFEGKLPSKPSGNPVAFSGKGDQIVVASRSQNGYTTLALVSLSTGKFRKIFEWHGSLDHPQICPGDNNLITFDPEDSQNDMTLPMEKRARTWILDVKKGTARPFLIAPYGTRATHEYWDFRGDRLYFHQKTVPGWTPTTIASVNRLGEDWQDHFTSYDRKLGHSSIDRKSTFLIADVQATTENELWRIDLCTGKGRVLCWPNTTPIKDQTVHAHPSISASGNYADFTSDQFGSSDVFVMPMKQVTQEI